MEVELNALEASIVDCGRPMRLTELVATTVKSWLQKQRGRRRYSPGAEYQVGEEIWFEGGVATVVKAALGHNSKQGQFQIITLRLNNGDEKQMAAALKGFKGAEVSRVVEDDLQLLLNEGGVRLRCMVEAALEADERFVWVPDGQGGQWYLADHLLDLHADEVREIARLLGEVQKEGEMPEPVPTEKLVKALADLEDDGSEIYQRYAFSVEAHLQRYRDFVHFPGEGWVLATVWEKFAQREGLQPPRQPNVVPPTTVVEEKAVHGRAVKKSNSAEPLAKPVPEDFITWQENRLQSAQFTFYAKHYYGTWLPLTKALRRVFPSKKSQVRFYHRFGGEEASFLALVDPEQRRVLGGEAMYHAFYDNRVYPGAKLVVSHRGNFNEYDLRTKQVEPGQTVQVRRLELGDDGILEDWLETEPMRYQVDKYVFVGDVRWEDKDALFEQANQIGAGIFALMFRRCHQWQEERGKPLHVTAEELYQAIHFDVEVGRPTAMASINWELWRRLAFKNCGDGHFLFRPEYGDKIRPTISSSTRKAEVRRNFGPTVVQDRMLATLPVEAPSDIAQEIVRAAAIDTDRDERASFYSIHQRTEQTAAPSYFIFQQHPSAESEYADRVGQIYNWKEGIPGSKQIEEGARFVYYRPGERVFFGTGRVDRISSYRVDGVRFFDGHLNEYEQWLPALPLTPRLGRLLSFIDPERQLGVGQSGIRKISKRDFDTIVEAAEDWRRQAGNAWVDTAEVEVDRFWGMFKNLEGTILQTLGQGAEFRVVSVSQNKIDIRVLSSGNEYTVYRSTLERVWNELVRRGDIEQTAIRKQLGEPSPTYVASILAALPTVEHTNGPIRLHARARRESTGNLEGQ